MATIQGVYVALFGRPADPTGLAFFNTATNNGANLNAIGNLAGQPEYTARFAGQNNIQIINSIYQSLFGRDADLTGLNFFADALTKGTLNINNIAIAILDGAQGTDKTIVANKVAAADLYTKALDTGSEVVAYNGAAAAEQGRTFIKGVTATVPAQAAVDQAVATMVTNSSGGGANATFTLTPGADFADQAGAYRNGSTQPFDFKFTSASETVIASTATLGNTDSLIDASTADKDRLNLAVTGATTFTGAVTNIENLNFDVSGVTAAAAIDLRGISGSQTITLTGAAGGAITLADSTAGINGTGVTTVDASGMNSAVNGVTATFAGNGTANLTFKGSLAGDSFTGDLGADKIDGGAGNDTLNGGAGNDTINGGAGNDTIDGGTNDDIINGDDGNDTIVGGLGNDVITGGAGNDAITTSGGTDTVTGGAGNDTITLTAGAGNSEKIVFEATNNGSDEIVGFVGGAVAAGGDVLDFSAMLGVKATFSAAVTAATVAPGGAGYSAAGGENVIVIGNGVALDTDGTLGLSLAELQASTLRLGANAKSVVLYDANADTADAANGNDVLAYFVTTDVNGAYASVSLVGTIDTTTSATFSAANFA